MICCYELFLAWFCGYDVGTVLDMILIWIQLWFLMWVKIVIWSQPIGTISKIVSTPNRNRIKIMSKAYQNRIKIVSKSYQQLQKTSRNRPKGCPGAVSVSFLEANPSGTLKKALRSQTISKPYQNHIQNIPKPYLNHNPNHIKNITKPYRNHKPKFKTYQIHIFQSYQKPY